MIRIIIRYLSLLNNILLAFKLKIFYYKGKSGKEMSQIKMKLESII